MQSLLTDTYDHEGVTNNYEITTAFEKPTKHWSHLAYTFTTNEALIAANLAQLTPSGNRAIAHAGAVDRSRLVVDACAQACRAVSELTLAQSGSHCFRKTCTLYLVIGYLSHVIHST